MQSVKSVELHEDGTVRTLWLSQM